MQTNKIVVFASILCIILLIVDAFCLPTFIDLLDYKINHSFIFWSYRLPKALTACIVGANLALAGFILQQMYANHLAGPYILGISSGASLAVSITISRKSQFFGGCFWGEGYASFDEFIFPPPHPSPR